MVGERRVENLVKNSLKSALVKSTEDIYNTNFFYKTLTIFLSTLGIYLFISTFNSITPICNIITITFIFVISSFFYLAYQIDIVKLKFIYFGVLVSISLIALSLYSSQILNCSIEVYNNILNSICLVERRIPEDLQVLYYAQNWHNIVFNILITDILLFIFSICALNSLIFVPILFLAFITFLNCYTENFSIISILLLLISIIILIFDKISFKYTDNTISINRTLKLSAHQIITIIIMIITIFVVLLIPNNELNSILNIKYFLDNIKYSKSDILPEGNFKNLSDFNPTNREVIKLIMSSPQSCYLRGYIGEEYTNYGWKGLDNEKVFEYKDMFYWLHTSDFYSQTILSNLQNDKNKDKNRIIINNINANKKYIYTPYELCNSELLDSNSLSSCIYSDIGNSKTSYSYNTEIDIMKTRNQEFKNKNIDNKYFNCEAHYRNLAYDMYLDIPENTKNVISNILGKYNKNEHMPYSLAKQNILNALGKMEYSTSNSYNESCGDFVAYFLQNLNSGYSVHFASATALMLRYYGIPSRYVEGYIITPNDIKNLDKNSELTITEKNSHIWAEYYEDGKGWIPFETTPTYIGVIETDDILKYNSFDKNISDNQPKKEEKSEPNLENEPPKIQEDTNLNLFFSIISICLILITLTICISILVIRRLKLIKIYSSFNDEDNNNNNNNKSVLNMFNYVTNLFLKFKYISYQSDMYDIQNKIKLTLDENYIIAYGKAYAVFEKAKFSNHMVSDDEKRIFKDFLNSSIKIVKNHNGKLRNIIYKFLSLYK